MQFKIINLEYNQNSKLLFELFSRKNHAVFLDSSISAKFPETRFDIISFEPYKILTTFSEIKENINITNFKKTREDIPFYPGAIGFFSYEANDESFKINNSIENDLEFPLIQVGLYAFAIIIDHKKKLSYLIYDMDKISEFYPNNYIEELLNNISNITENKNNKRIKSEAKFIPDIDKEKYKEQFNEVKNLIKQGECYQINLTQRFTLKNFPFNEDFTSWDLYKKLNEINPAPFSAYLKLDNNNSIISLSPEKFIEIKDNIIKTKPIKGTIKRSNDKKQDELNKQELLNSKKDFAENTMITDLLRNDLNMCSQIGSVKVEKLCALETYPAVHHLVSTISAKNNNMHPVDVFKTCFPGGSITGAPKKRAIEIINNTETTRRNIYCGSIAYFSADGSMDSSITIRTLLQKDNNLYLWSGGGIVMKSELESEYSEVFAKIKKIIEAV